MSISFLNEFMICSLRSIPIWSGLVGWTGSEDSRLKDKVVWFADKASEIFKLFSGRIQSPEQKDAKGREGEEENDCARNARIRLRGLRRNNSRE